MASLLSSSSELLLQWSDISPSPSASHCLALPFLTIAGAGAPPQAPHPGAWARHPTLWWRDAASDAATTTPRMPRMPRIENKENH